jgi:hypothetical protein
MKKIQRSRITDNAKLLAKHKKEYNPFCPMLQNTEYILWQKTYHKNIKYTKKQWESIIKGAKL